MQSVCWWLLLSAVLAITMVRESEGGDENDGTCDYEYIGCFVDKEDRDLNGKFVQNDKMDVKQCQEICRGYKYFSVQYGIQCFCGNNVGKHGAPVAKKECDYPCAGNNKQICGGFWRNSVYSYYATVEVVDVTLNYEYIGCFVDTEDRDLGELWIPSTNASLKHCGNLCRGYLYFGMQAHDHCLCGSQYGRHGRSSESDCKMPCIGNAKEICGSDWRNSVYHYQGTPRFVGCFVDKEDRDLSAKFVQNDKMDVNQCQEICRGYKYFSVQYGIQCFCGNSVGKHGGPVATKECDYRCSGNKKQICGGFWRNSVYSYYATVEDEEVAMNFEYIGCFVDTEDRDLGELWIPSTNASLKHCGNLCRGYSYFGMQAHDHCLCGNQYGRHGRSSESECKMPCIGNEKEICGSAWRNSIYHYQFTSRFVGCYVDKEDRDLSAKFVENDKMDLKQCQEICRGFKYFSVQYGIQCFCGNSVGKHGGPVATKECDYRCSGNKKQFCGGFWRNSVFSYSDTPDTPEILGCFVDNNDDRDLNGKFQENWYTGKLSSQECQQICKGFKYFGLQYRSQCFCGNSFGKHGGPVASAECNLPCIGNGNEMCGGTNRNSIYRNSA